MYYTDITHSARDFILNDMEQLIFVLSNQVWRTGPQYK